MELDKRIKDITDIQSVTSGCHDWQFMTKKGYFAESITEFEDLKKCVYAEYIGYREHERCFHYWNEKDGKDYTHYARYFIPEDSLLPEEKPVEKKYRPLSYKEFWRLFDFGDEVCFRRKGQNTAECSMFLGYEIDSNGNRDEIPGEGKVNLGGNRYTLAELFEYYEVRLDDKWQPFGVIDEEGTKE